MKQTEIIAQLRSLRESQADFARTNGDEIFKRDVEALDVAMMMTLLKVARIKTGHYKADSYIDACGYLAFAAEIAGR